MLSIFFNNMWNVGVHKNHPFMLIYGIGSKASTVTASNRPNLRSPDVKPNEACGLLKTRGGKTP